jgi:hypothetical protein
LGSGIGEQECGYEKTGLKPVKTRSAIWFSRKRGRMFSVHFYGALLSDPTAGPRNMDNGWNLNALRIFVSFLMVLLKFI